MFEVCFIHKISQRCKCGRSQYEHSREPREDEKHRYPYAGQRVYGEGPFVSFATREQTCPGFEIETEMVDIPDILDRVVAHARMASGSKGDVSMRDGKIVFFPRRGIWHSIIYTSVS